MEKLPSDILGDVFLMSLPQNTRRTKRYLDSILAPLYISHVCRHWRALSLSIQELWSYLHLVVIETYGTARRERVIEVFDTWLQRTGGCPLNFTIWCLVGSLSIEKGEELHSTAEYFTVNMVSQQRRWKDVDFHCLVSTSRLEMTDMPLLTSLSLRFCALRSKKDRKCAIVDVSRSLRLRQLQLEGDCNLQVGDQPIHTSIESINLNLALSRLSLMDMEVAACSCLDLLRASPYAKRLHLGLSVVRFDPSQMNALPIRVVHDLKILKISLRHCARVINSLTLPSLEALSYNDDYDRPGELFLSFIQRSMPPLTYLEMNGLHSNEDALIAALALLPTLRDLRIVSFSVSTRFFLELTVTNGADADGAPLRTSENGILCPDLRFLSLNCLMMDQGLESCVEAFCSMLDSRSTTFGTLKRSNIQSLCDDMMLDRSSFKTLLRMYIESGKTIEVWDDVYPEASPFEDE